MDGNKKSKMIRIGVACLVVVCMVGVAFFILHTLISDNTGKRQRKIQRVTLVKPPPPKPKEKPPEPEIKKKEEVVQPEEEELPPEEIEDLGEDEAPPGEDLGLDADGSGAGDGFGLKANKGGRSIIGQTGGKNLLKRYAWYTRILQEEIRDKVNKVLEEREDIPAGEHQMILRIKLDDTGQVQFLSVINSSGNATVDNVVDDAVTGLSISEAPPGKMPKTMKIKITFKS